MIGRIKIFEGIIKAALCCMVLAVMVQSGSSQEREKRVPIPVSVKRNIRVVYQIKDDEWKEGIGKGLYYVQKLVGAYDSMGIDPKERSIHAVLHGSAGYWMLRDALYNKIEETDTGNPNKATIRNFVKQGVSIELCAQTMKSHGWVSEDILSEVKVVVGAYPRIIDLQMQGYAYIRF